MGTRASSYVACGQIGLVLFLGLCVALDPGIALRWNEVGLSNYALHLETAVSYTFAFAAAAAGAWLGARRVADRVLARTLRWYALIVVLMTLTSYLYTINGVWKEVHAAVGLVTMVFEAVAAWSMYRRLRPWRWGVPLMALELVGCAASIVDVATLLHVLLLAQVLIGAGFGSFVVRAARDADLRVRGTLT
jgi:hypothetical protein